MYSAHATMSGSSGADPSKPNTLTVLVRMQMSSDSCQRLSELDSLGGGWVESLPQFAQFSPTIDFLQMPL